MDEPENIADLYSQLDSASDPIAEAEKELAKFENYQGVSTDKLKALIINIQSDLCSGIVKISDIAESMHHFGLLIEENRRLYKKLHEHMGQYLTFNKRVSIKR